MIRVRRKRIGKYAVTARLGGGRYGVCYLARDKEGNPVVLKRFRRWMWKKNRDSNHYEAVILSGLDDPRIPALLGVINSRQGYYFVMEYKEGIPIEALLFKDGKVFSDKEIYEIGCQLLDILVYLHDHSVVHGDISPANVLDDKGRICLIDFGLARYENGCSEKFDLDYARFADLLLYLIYSSYQGKGKKAWYEDEALVLTEKKRHFLKRMLGLERQGFKDTREVREAFDRCFSVTDEWDKNNMGG